ncbi:hypothetical protein J8F10_10370 [Gemmata sp. G18]|uniref:KfrA N-terminal DNA-binding domain-containing protein n=1 Tax=Gemmata palustris TaxID=2822762 RepID=A0ABS5BQV3_9BACT|nr:hypothetical protein [Gemmata palustris]MBP3955685.1 hypothetical protein [Gemmata palustris]
MPVPVMSSVVRAILSENLDLSADDVIRKAKVRGVTSPERVIRTTAHNIKSELKRRAAKASAPKPIPAAARTTKTPDRAPCRPRSLWLFRGGHSCSGPNLVVSEPRFGLGAGEHRTGEHGRWGMRGAEPARRVAEAVRACGSVEAFLLHLNLIAQVRGTTV